MAQLEISQDFFDLTESTCVKKKHMPPCTL